MGAPRAYNEGVVAQSTNTSKKLKTYGIRCKTDRVKLLQFITEHLDYDGGPITNLIAESAVCEGLRFMNLKEQNGGSPYFTWPYWILYTGDNICTILQTLSFMFYVKMDIEASFTCETGNRTSHFPALDGGSMGK